MRARSIVSLITCSALLGGCTVGPKYQRPTVDVPGTYRGGAPGDPQNNPSATQANTAATFGNEKWWNVFQDEELQKLIKTALEQNYDVRIAAQRVLAAQAQVGITRADQFPTVSAGASAADQRIPQQKGSPAFETNATAVNLSASWALDFWGQFRKATERDRATLLSTQWAQREVIATLVSNVALDYFQLRSLDSQLDVSQRTLKAREESLRLTRILQKGGASSMLDVRQSEQLVYTASSQIPTLEQQIEQTENNLNILLARNPGPIARGKELIDEPHALTIPIGLPSDLLERRPDVQSAEAQLIAANAQIGVARAAYYPQITLTGAGGFQSSALSELFSGPSGLWSFGAGLTQPIFTAGRISSNVRLTEAQERQTLLSYQETIQGAFRDVANALVAYHKARDFREQQENLARSADDASRLSLLRYKGGATDYLEVLTNDTNAFSAELGVVQARYNELAAFVQLYQALGGGWQN
jgi:outer membrane protein, multidrug efflux system